MPSFMLLLFLADCRMGHAKIFIGKSWKVTSLEPADGFTSFLAEKLRTIKAVNVDTSTGPKIESNLYVQCICYIFDLAASKTLGLLASLVRLIS